MKQLLNHLKSEWWKYGLETIVVVMGILIAFGLNNWNENQKLRIKSKEYRERLIDDIVSDTTNIHNDLELRRKTISNIEAYFNFFETNLIPLEVIVDTALRVDFDLLRYFPVNYTFEDMQSSGNLNMLNPEQQRIMSELSHLQKFSQLVAEKLMSGFYLEAGNENKYLGRRRPKKSFYKTLGMKQDPQAMAQGLLHRHNLLYGLLIYHRTMINRGNDVIQKSKKAINILRNKN